MSKEDAVKEFEGEIRKYSRASSFIETNIAEISKPGKYRIVGTIVGLEENLMVVSDETDEIVVDIADISNQDLKEGKQLQLFGFVEIEPEKKFKAIIIHDFSDVNIEMYRQVRELEQSLRKNTP